MDLSFTKVEGRLLEVPRSVMYLNLEGNKFVTVDLANVPHSLSSLDLSGCEQATGNLKALRGVPLTSLSLWNCRRLLGNLSVFQGLALTVSVGIQELQ